MNATKLAYSDLRSFLALEPVSVLLYVDSSDPRTSSLLKKLANVANEFMSGISFGWIDIALLSKTERTTVDEGVTPCLVFLRGREVVENATESGLYRTTEKLSRSNIWSWLEKTDGGAVLIR